METKQKQTNRLYEQLKKKSASWFVFSKVRTIQTIWMIFALAKPKWLSPKNCEVTFSFDCPAEWNHGLKAVSPLLFHKGFILFSFNRHIYFCLIMALIHKTVKLAHYFQLYWRWQRKNTTQEMLFTNQHSCK